MADTLDHIGFKKWTSTEISAGTAFTVTTDANTSYVIKDILTDQGSTTNPIELKARVGLTANYNAGNYADLGVVSSGTVEGATGSLIIPPSSTFALVPTALAINYYDIYYHTYRTNTNQVYHQANIPFVNGIAQPTLATKPFNNKNFSTASGFGNHVNQYPWSTTQRNGQWLWMVTNSNHSIWMTQFTTVTNWNNRQLRIADKDENTGSGQNLMQETSSYVKVQIFGGRYLVYPYQGSKYLNVKDMYDTNSSGQAFGSGAGVLYMNTTSGNSVAYSHQTSSQEFGCNVSDSESLIIHYNGQTGNSTQLRASRLPHSKLDATKSANQFLASDDTWLLMSGEPAVGAGYDFNDIMNDNSNTTTRANLQYLLMYDPSKQKFLFMIMHTSQGYWYFAEFAHGDTSMPCLSKADLATNWGISENIGESQGSARLSFTDTRGGLSGSPNQNYDYHLADYILSYNYNNVIRRYDLRTGVATELDASLYNGGASNGSLWSQQVYPDASTIAGRTYVGAPGVSATILGVKST